MKLTQCCAMPSLLLHCWGIFHLATGKVCLIWRQQRGIFHREQAKLYQSPQNMKYNKTMDTLKICTSQKSLCSSHMLVSVDNLLIPGFLFIFIYYKLILNVISTQLVPVVYTLLQGFSETFSLTLSPLACYLGKYKSTSEFL